MDRRPPAPRFPEELPVLALREFVVFPYMVLPLFVSRERSIAAIDEAMDADRLVLLVAQRDPETEDPDPDQLYRVGTVAMVMRTQHLADGRLKVLVQGLGKVRVDSVIDRHDGLWVRTSPMDGDEEGAEEWTVEGEALTRAVRARVEELLPLKNLPPEVLAITTNVQSPGRLADLVASNLRLRLAEAQEVLEVQDPIARLRRVDTLLKREIESSASQIDLPAGPARDELSREHREAFLREQLRAIQNELGEVDPRAEEFDEYRLKVEEASLPEVTREEAMRQLRRLERMHPDGPEAQVVRNYLDWVVELPWDRCSPDRLDLEEARDILDRDHAHLSTVKDRILEFLGVRKLRQDSRGPILCLAGPPGVGKTSLGRSIARAMGREFVRVSLGGVRDEAEIRGHRRTYVGALPGRIIQAMKQAGTSNPVMMLDELDKLGNDFRGDPSAALLEVLDPEQNREFSDHFLNTPFDLSRVLFIATANMLDPIPAPLRDRMEVIQLAGYTPEEKCEIATNFLIPRQVEEHGMAPDELTWTRNAITSLCSEYTYEAGVRNLERQVAAICRKVARRRAEGDESKVVINTKSLDRLLGPPPYRNDHAGKHAEVGLVNGLAWTQGGGEVLSLEANLSHGRGLVLTGQLGDVMKESGQAALSFVRSILGQIGVDERIFTRRQVHVHVPAGATPKDGPSAGVAIATAIASLASGIPVRADVAMTGEVTLRGRVLPVGGVREKALAALRSGITTIVIPESNVSDLREIPKDLKKRLTFLPVGHMREVLDQVLVEPLEWRAKECAKKARPGVPRTTTPMHAADCEPGESI
ncbi:MAG: endopeptidase La [Spirochaetaceae bacterium]|nr:endopeptidase La [Myxococcales bacterium]MCB9725808.1 endopeptidase La [Spirochaetaceae bacterium]HPG24183.1 endopeptidase La [Myxococcota bacterium]